MQEPSEKTAKYQLLFLGVCPVVGKFNREPINQSHGHSGGRSMTFVGMELFTLLEIRA